MYSGSASGHEREFYPNPLSYSLVFSVLMQKRQLLIGASLVVVALLIACVLHFGSFLVVENVRQADAILVLAGDVNDRRYQKGIELLRAAYGRQLLLDASEDVTDRTRC